MEEKVTEIRNYLPIYFESKENNEYVDKYLYRNPMLLKIFKSKVNEGRKQSSIAINYWQRGHEGHAVAVVKKLFGPPCQ